MLSLGVITTLGVSAESPLTAFVATPPDAPLDRLESFLDRLMHAESGGRDDAANPRSTALGPFQFIKSTFLTIARSHFAEEVAGLSDEQILALRSNRPFARRAAAAYTRDNLAYLVSRGLRPGLSGLRLAFLVGPAAAAQVLEARPNAPLSTVLTATAIRANPFMLGMRAADLIAKAARDVGEQAEQFVTAGVLGVANLHRHVEHRSTAHCARAGCHRVASSRSGSRSARPRWSRVVHRPVRIERQKA
jgi:hypothetical protein